MSECSDNRKAAKGKGVGSAAPFGTVSANAVRHYAEFVLKRAARALGVIPPGISLRRATIRTDLWRDVTRHLSRASLQMPTQCWRYTRRVVSFGNDQVTAGIGSVALAFCDQRWASRNLPTRPFAGL